MKPGDITMGFLLSFFIVLVYSPHAGKSVPSDCCLKIPSECHFLCGVGSVGFWSVTKWKCTAKYYPTVVKCKFTDGVDYIKMFGKHLTQKVKAGFDNLSLEIKKKLQNAKEFAKATVSELMQVPQDVLCNLKESLAGMTSLQFRGLVQRFTKFTAQNLRNLISSVSPQTLFDNINELTGQDWDPEQLAALLKAAFKRFGREVKTWGREAFGTLKELVAGIDSGELMEITAEAFQEVTKFLCSAKLNDDQKKALLVPAKTVYGDVSTWDGAVLTKLCSLLHTLPVEELLKLTAEVVAEVINIIDKAAEFNYPQGRALLDKVKKELGSDVSNWSASNIKKLGKLLKDLDVNDFKKLLQQQFKDLAGELGDVEWSPGRARQLAKKAIESLGEPAKWTATNLKEVRNIAGGLLPSELKQILNKVMKNALKAFKRAELEIDQAQEIVIKFKTEINNQLQQVDGDDLISLVKALDGFLASDIGQMTQLAVFAVFPELKVAKVVAMPIIRKLIKMAEKDSSGKSKLERLQEVAVGLSRSELDDESVESLVNNLDKLGAIPWDKTQVIELTKKIRDKWGSINETDSSDSDTPNWGFINLKKLGRIALGIAKEELRDLPIQGIEDAVDVLGKQKDWDRGQVTMVLKRLREYWVMEEHDFSNFTELDINSLGAFVQGLTGNELKNLPERVLLIAVRRLGQETGIPQDKLKTRAFIAVEFFTNQTGIDVLNSTHIQDMGNLVTGLSRGALSKISKDAFVQNLYTITRSKGFDVPQMRKLAELARNHFKQSDSVKWTSKQWRDLGPAIVGLDANDLRYISKEALEEVLDEINTLDFSKAQAQALVSAAKKAFGKTDLREWTGDQLRHLGSIARGLDIADIISISKQGFEDAVGVWGKQLSIDLDNLKAMAALAKKHLVSGDVSKFTAMHLKRLGRVVLGLGESDLEKLNIDSIDVVAALGKWKGWTKQQLQVLKPKIKSFLVNNKVDIYDSYMSLGYLGVTLSKVDISQIPAKSFKLALKQLGDLDEWDEDQLKALMDKAKKTWNTGAEQWDKARVSELGYIQKGLSTTDIPKLDPKVIDTIKPEVLASMSVTQLQSFKAEQYRAMETPQVQAISMSKRNVLSAAQTAAIKDVTDDDPIEEDPWGEDSSDNIPSGASYVTDSLVSMLWIFWAAAYVTH